MSASKVDARSTPSPARGQTRLGLRDVGTGDLADRKAVSRLAQLLLQDVNVVAIEIEDRRVAQHVHVGRDDSEQGILLSIPQLLALAENLRFGLTDGTNRFVAVKDCLVDGTRAPRIKGGDGGAGDVLFGPFTSIRALNARIALALNCGR